MIRKKIGETLFNSASFLERHRVLRAFILLAVLAVFAFGIYRIVTLRSLPCLAGVCPKPVLPTR